MEGRRSTTRPPSASPRRPGQNYWYGRPGLALHLLHPRAHRRAPHAAAPPRRRGPQPHPPGVLITDLRHRRTVHTRPMVPGIHPLGDVDVRQGAKAMQALRSGTMHGAVPGLDKDVGSIGSALRPHHHPEGQGPDRRHPRFRVHPVHRRQRTRLRRRTLNVALTRHALPSASRRPGELGAAPPPPTPSCTVRAQGAADPASAPRSCSPEIKHPVNTSTTGRVLRPVVSLRGAPVGPALRRLCVRERRLARFGEARRDPVLSRRAVGSGSP